ncbi:MULTISPECIES: hypothetical protein [Adhaeribacter]|uniref:Uncharacterized protein n=2 Tax=Adhaeribacter TaxID=299566 RepID=A0A512B5Q7_9BACT|nr:MULTISPECIES: hypothetical protein [Adhaeribacter]KAA5542039.1 hypothetical protein F0145_19825 [Adhaeribacter rhizoryzae]GEO07305.1 hypothetical protein AAE02nite_49690 [Adhaeribacter aerolatus]
METNLDTLKLAQSASALGAGILGFGLGAKWGLDIANYALLIIVIGGILHVSGMYVMQMKNKSYKSYGVARALWISAWICLVALVALVIYLLV